MAPSALLPLRIEELSPRHDVASFSCGVRDLDDFLHKYAARNMANRISQTFVAVDQSVPETAVSVPILGYYTLSALSLSKDDLLQALVKRFPRYPIPLSILGRLAVQRELQSQGLGRFLLFDAFSHVVEASKHVAVYALIVDAMFDNLVPWYEKYGFQRLPHSPRRLFITVETLVEGS